MKPVIAHFVRKSTQLRLSFIYNQIENLKEHRPVIVYSDEPEMDESGYAQIDPDKHLCFHSGKNRNLFRQMVYRYFKRISKKESQGIIHFLREQNVKGFHLHFGTDASIYWRVMRNSGIPSFVSFYGYDCSSFPKRFAGLGRCILQRKVFSHATRVLAMSPDMKADLIRLGCPEEKIMVHYYGTDVKKYFTKTRDKKEGKRITLLTAGRLDEKKGHLFLLKALEQLKKEHSADFEWIIAGDGNQREAIAQEIIRCNLSNEVKMVGAYPYNSNKLQNLFAETDIYIQPSITAKDGDKEGIPGTLIEAMAAGLPVISTIHAGIPSIVEHQKSGLLVSEWDVESLARSIQVLCYDPDLPTNLGKAGQESAMLNLNLETREQELETIYSSLIN